MIYTDGTHLVSNNLDELHKFAHRIGLKRKWFQNHRIPHYDLMGSKPKRALEEGAILLHPHKLLKILKVGKGETDGNPLS